MLKHSARLGICTRAYSALSGTAAPDLPGFPELHEAAQIGGCGDTQFSFLFVLPLSKGVMIGSLKG